MNLGSALGKALSSGRGKGSVSNQVGQLGGTRAVAGKLGVSQRTVQRWAKADREGRGARGIPAARREALGNEAARDDLKRNGAKIRGTAVAGPQSGGSEYHTRRVLGNANGGSGIELSPEAMARVIERYEAGDVAGAEEAFNDAIATEYLGGSAGEWGFSDVMELLITGQ